MEIQAVTKRKLLSTNAKWTFLSLITLILITAAIITAEIAVRFRQTLKYGTMATTEQVLWNDKSIGLRVPFANLASGRINTNSRGFRSPEIVIPKPVGTVRLAYLGASTTWCAEVSSNEIIWPNLVTASLQDAFPWVAIDYVNGGVPGYTVSASLKNLQHRITQLEPDIIVIYHAANDLSGELREIAVKQGILETTQFKEFSWLGRYSLLWNLAEKNLRVFLAQRAASANFARIKINPETMGNQFRSDLTELIHEAHKSARIVAVATFAIHLRPGQSEEQQKRAMTSVLFYTPFMTPKGLIDAYDRYNEIIREVARVTGVVLIESENSIPGDPAHFVDSVHFSDEGSRAMADQVTRSLLANRDIVMLFRQYFGQFFERKQLTNPTRS